MATFQKHWITPGAAVFTKHGPQVTLLSPSQDREPPLSGGVHLRTAAAWSPRPGSGTGRQVGWCQRVTSAQTEARSTGYRP